jgi:hypothetical protein
MDKSKVVTVKTFNSETEALIVKGLLDSAGIESSLLHEDLQSVLPLQSVSQIELAVAAEDVQRAREVLAAKYDKEDFAEQTGTAKPKSRCGCGVKK